MKSFHLVILAPDKTFLEQEADMITVPTKMGMIGILADHYPLIGIIVTGVMHVQNDNVIRYYTISGGVISVQTDKTVILAEAIERPGEIDVSRAKAAKERAEALLASKDPNIDLKRAQAALERALNRIKAHEEYK